MTNPNSNPNETPDLSPMAQDLIRAEAPDGALEALLAELEETADELRTELQARKNSKQQLLDDSAANDTAPAAQPTELDQEPVQERTEEVVTPEGAAGAAATKAGEAPRKPKKTNPNVTPEQQAELDENFARYWNNAQGSWKNLFQLLREFRNEMREGKSNA